MKNQLLAKRLSNSKKIFLVSLIIIIIVLIIIFPKKDFGNTENIFVQDNLVNFDTLTLQQKISQMIMVRGDNKNMNYNNLNVGGIFLDRQNSEEKYVELISNYQENSKIKLFVATDMEGAWTPFRKNVEEHQKFPPFDKINSSVEAYEVGLKHGELLKSIGFNLNFAPVAEYEDLAYGGRVFSGNVTEVNEKIEFYIEGLQENVFGTCKHYPGKSLLKNLHDESETQDITEEDLLIFDNCIEKNISSIMVSHQISTGLIDSKGKPSTVSPEVLETLSEYEGLIIADEINMEGLSLFYPDKIDLYVDLINSGEELILDFYLTNKQLKNLLENIEEKVLSGEIDENKIDNAVTKILLMKGYEIISSI